MIFKQACYHYIVVKKKWTLMERYLNIWIEMSDLFQRFIWITQCTKNATVPYFLSVHLGIFDGIIYLFHFCEEHQIKKKQISQKCVWKIKSGKKLLHSHPHVCWLTFLKASALHPITFNTTVSHLGPGFEFSFLQISLYAALFYIINIEQRWLR